MADNYIYNFAIQNNGENDIYLEQVDRLNRAIIDNPQEYNLSVLKFSLPVNAIRNFKVTGAEDYSIVMGCLNSKIATGVDPAVNYKGRAFLPTSSNYLYNDYQDVIEAFNRSSQEAYREYINSYNTDYSNKFTSSGTINVDTTANNFLETITMSAPSGADTLIGYVELSIRSYYTADNNYRPVRVTLIAADATECIVYNNAQLNVNNTYLFTDASFNSLSDWVDKDNTSLTKSDYQPLEAFNKFNTGNGQLGNWAIRVEDVQRDATNNRLRVTIDYTLTVTYLPKNNNSMPLHVMSEAPSLVYDDTSQKLQLLLPERMFAANNYIGFSAKLRNLLGFKCSTTALSDSLGYKEYALRLPQVSLSANQNNLITMEQPISTIYLFNNLRKVIIKTSLDVIGEFDSITQDRILLAVDLNVNSGFDRLEFSSTQENRLYDLITNVPIENIGISIWGLYEGDTNYTLLSLASGQTFSLTLKFSKKK